MANGFKTGGRQKGSLNKTTIANREKLQKIFDTLVDSGKLLDELNSLTGKDFINAVLKITPYLVPRSNNDNAAEMPEEEPKGKQRVPRFYFIQTTDPEMVERRRAADPDEEELCQLLFPEKKQPQILDTDGNEEEKPKEKMVNTIFLPVSTPEETNRFNKDEISDLAFAKLILYNDKNRLKWFMEGNPHLKGEELKRTFKREEGISEEEWNAKYRSALLP